MCISVGAVFLRSSVRMIPFEASWNLVSLIARLAVPLAGFMVRMYSIDSCLELKINQSLKILCSRKKLNAILRVPFTRSFRLAREVDEYTYSIYANRKITQNQCFLAIAAP